MNDDEQDMDGSEWLPYGENSNTASENASVAAQIGANYGPVHARVSSTYIYNGNSPEDLLRVAINYLVADEPRAAEKILHELMWGRQPTTKRAYYYALSVLGGRSIYEIDSDLVAEIRKAWNFCSLQVRDPWCQALEAVMGLLRCLPYKASEEATFDATQWDGQWEDIRAFDEVPAERQDEIRQHLTLIASGRVKERLEAGARDRVLAEKVRADRVGRVWKFFEPDPLEPRLYPLPPLEAKSPDWWLLAGGPLLLLVGAAVVAVHWWWTAVLVLGALLGSIRLLMPFGVDSAARQLVEDAESREAQRLRTLEDPTSPGHWVSNRLVADLGRVVEEQFTDARPHRRGTWSEQTVEVRAYLKERLVAQYGNSRQPADAVTWLARWYARRAATQDGPAWQPRGLDEREPVELASARRPLWLGAATTVATLGVLVAVGQLAGALLLGVGEVWTIIVAQQLAASRRAIELRERAERRLLVEEQQGFEEWLQVLADRPTDAEMARWLAMDKAHVRYEAIERAGLAEHDVVTHVVMAEGAKGAKRLRLRGGPLRYSAYMVRIFVLSYSGVQEVTAELDFGTGDILNERRNHFRYESVASANAQEKGVRQIRNVKGKPTRSERLRTVSFKLRLVNNEEAVSVRDSYRRPDSDVAVNDQDEELADLVLRNSGFDGVLRILESVASQGSDWIRRHEERRERWAHSLFD